MFTWRADKSALAFLLLNNTNKMFLPLENSFLAESPGFSQASRHTPETSYGKLRPVSLLSGRVTECTVFLSWKLKTNVPLWPLCYAHSPMQGSGGLGTVKRALKNEGYKGSLWGARLVKLRPFHVGSGLDLMGQGIEPRVLGLLTQ